MADVDKLDGAEEVLRAILQPQWDPALGRISPSLFEGADVSLSRLALCTEDEIFTMFFRDLDKPDRLVMGAGQLSVAAIEAVGANYQEKPTTLWVAPDPVSDIGHENPAHAVIPPKISRGLSRKLVAEMGQPFIEAQKYRAEG